MSEWQDISTAPKDGSSVLCYIPLQTMSKPNGSRVLVLRWDDGEYTKMGPQWLTDVYAFVPFSPTHWMPLPAPPTKETPDA
jgi:hypothetical protein